MSGRWAVGVDVGGTKIEAARVAETGMAGAPVRVATDVAAGPAGVVAQVVEAARRLSLDAGGPPAALGAGVAGQIDGRTGSVVFGPNLGWRDVPLRSDIETALGIPCVVMNDVRAAAFGEWLHGAGRGFDDIVCVYVGTGIGGGVVSGGRLLAGCTNTAGEIGHITVEIDGPACTCGNRGCLEAIAGGWALAAAAKRAIEADPGAGSAIIGAAGGSVEAVSARSIAVAAAAGDRLALRLLDAAGRALAAGCVSLVNAFNPCRLILGGGVIDGMPDLVERVRRGVAACALPSARSGVEVVRSVLGPEAGAVGAGSLALSHARRGRGERPPMGGR